MLHPEKAIYGDLLHVTRENYKQLLFTYSTIETV